MNISLRINMGTSNPVVLHCTLVGSNALDTGYPVPIYIYKKKCTDTESIYFKTHLAHHPSTRYLRQVHV